MLSSNNVGDMMKDAKGRALRTLAVAASVIVYAAMLAYTGVHNYTLLTAGVPEGLMIWAIVGVVALEISAAALPIALHYWTHAPLQRMAALAFYAVDMALLWLNVALDFAGVAGTGLLENASWLRLYLEFGAPATPLVAGLGWSIIWLLDPAQRERATVEALAASTREVLAARLADAARGADVDAIVTEAAQSMAREIVSGTLGVPALPVTPGVNGNGKAVATTPKDTG